MSNYFICVIKLGSESIHQHQIGMIITRMRMDRGKPSVSVCDRLASKCLGCGVKKYARGSEAREKEVLTLFC